MSALPRWPFIACGTLWALLAFGCAHDPFMHTGAKMPPPTGAIQFCKDNPSDVLCKK